jgi:hypothetical protein
LEVVATRFQIYRVFLPSIQMSLLFVDDSDAVAVAETNQIRRLHVSERESFARTL